MSPSSGLLQHEHTSMSCRRSASQHWSQTATLHCRQSTTVWEVVCIKAQRSEHRVQAPAEQLTKSTLNNPKLNLPALLQCKSQCPCTGGEICIVQPVNHVRHDSWVICKQLYLTWRTRVFTTRKESSLADSNTFPTTGFSPATPLYLWNWLR